MSTSGTETKKKWSDFDYTKEDDEFPQSSYSDDDDDGRGVVTNGVVHDGESNVSTSVQIKTKPNGEKVKVVKNVRVYQKKVRVNRGVLLRKNIKIFGDATGGLEPGISMIGDEVQLEKVSKTLSGHETDSSLSFAKSDKNKKKGSSSARKEMTTPSWLVCRACGEMGDHWTASCPLNTSKKTPTPGDKVEGGTPAGSKDQQQQQTEPENKYVIPSLRGRSGAGSSMSDDYNRRRDDLYTIRVTNLSEDTKDEDLKDLFRPFGPIARVYLAKDKATNLSKGFAFVNFTHREDAARAIQQLSGFGYDHLILHLEWANKQSQP